MDSINLNAVKQAARQALHVAQDKLKLAEAAVGSSEYQDLDVAIIKATSSATHVAPKEKHVQTLKAAVGPHAPRAQVAYVAWELRSRLRSATDWLTALKTLMVFHRLIRECDASLLDELLKLGRGAPPPSSSAAANGDGVPPSRAATSNSKASAPRLSLDGWVDTTTVGQSRFDFSSYVRALARYLDEQLDVYERINYLIESDRGGGGGEGQQPSATAFGGGGRGSRFRSLSAGDLLFQLPRVQSLLLRLADCGPAGAAAADDVVAASLAPVVKESFRGYRAASEGVINLADSLFEMTPQAATAALDCYRSALLLTSKLQAFYRSAEGVAGMRGAVQFPRLEPPPADFVGQIEEYIASSSANGSGGGSGGGSVSAAPAAAAAAAPAFVPLRRGRFLSTAAAATAAAPLPPSSSSVPRSPPAPVDLPPSTPSSPSLARQQQQQQRDPGMLFSSSASAAPSPSVVAPAAAAAPSVDLLGDLLSPAPAEASGSSTSTAAAPTAPFDPFGPVEAAPAAAPASPPKQSPSPFGNGSGAAAPPSFAPAAAGLLGANPFGAAAPAEFSAAPAAPSPAAVAAPAASPPATAFAPSPSPPPSAPAPPSQQHDPFASLMGNLSLGPNPNVKPPLKAMGPEKGRPMSSSSPSSSQQGEKKATSFSGDAF